MMKCKMNIVGGRLNNWRLKTCVLWLEGLVEHVVVMCSLLLRRVAVCLCVFIEPETSLWKKSHQKYLLTISFISELFSDKSNTHEFVDLVKELALPGELTQNRSYDFEFMQVEKPYESYVGANVRLRYICYILLRSNILVYFRFKKFIS